MDNYKEKRQGGYAPRNGNRERSFDNNFNGEYRKKQRPRFTKEQDGRGNKPYSRNEYRGNAEGTNRYSSYNARPQHNGASDAPYNRYEERREQG